MTLAERAVDLVLEHVDRAVTGAVDDPAVLAAVVAVERLVVASGSTDAAILRAGVEGATRPGAEADDPVVAVVLDALSHVRMALQRKETGQLADAGVVNRDAGTHRVTTDAELVRAAVRAGQRSFDATPYYRARYGMRGSRFASSDSAWLVSLAPLPVERAVHHALWLATVLAGRGMPSWLLERHLTELAVEVDGVDPGAVGSLPATARALANRRRRHVDDDLLGSADDWAVEATRGRVPVAGAGALLAAALADARSGVLDHDRGVVEWLTAPSRCTPTVREALLGVRARVADRAG